MRTYLSLKESTRFDWREISAHSQRSTSWRLKQLSLIQVNAPTWRRLNTGRQSFIERSTNGLYCPFTSPFLMSSFRISCRICPPAFNLKVLFIMIHSFLFLIYKPCKPFKAFHKHNSETLVNIQENTICSVLRLAGFYRHLSDRLF